MTVVLYNAAHFGMWLCVFAVGHVASQLEPGTRARRLTDALWLSMLAIGALVSLQRDS